jgi:glutamyl/glutaminyl-tRNA synthetase
MDNTRLYEYMYDRMTMNVLVQIAITPAHSPASDTSKRTLSVDGAHRSATWTASVKV